MNSLFEASEQSNLERAKPLAARMRPTNLTEFVGQQHFLGEGKLLRRLLQTSTKASQTVLRRTLVYRRPLPSEKSSKQGLTQDVQVYPQVLKAFSLLVTRL